MLILLGIITFAVVFVGLMNWLQGEKHLFGNKIRKTIKELKK